MQKFTNIDELIAKYDGFIFDLYGVIYDGSNSFESAVNLIKKLEELNKAIFYLSNAPRPYFVSVPKLRSYGLNVHKGNLVTSGDLFRIDYKNKLNPIFNLGYGKFYQIGKECNSDLLINLTAESVDSVNHADFIVLTSYVDDLTYADKYDAELELAKERDLPLICTNPDKIVIDNKKIRYPAGFFADRYLEMGGEVYYYGKPNPDSYNWVYQNFFLPKDIEKSKILMLGDSVDTDILGASKFGIDSALVMTGCAQHKLSEDEGYAKVISQYQPGYVLRDLG